MGDRLGIHGAVDFFLYLPAFPGSVVHTKLLVICPSPHSKFFTDNSKTFAPGEARTHGLQIMRLTRCLLRYGGTFSPASHPFLPTHSLGWTLKTQEKNSCQKGDSNPRPHKRTRNLHLSPIEGQGFRLESGALDHSAILTT